ncbi:MAG: NifU family protein [Planctomycetota bacterium]|jgi:Fe-S cluster biogenesis protein NfuA
MCEGCGCGGNVEEKVRSVVEEIRPNLQSHGGDIELLGVDEDNTVRVRLKGACSGCPSAAMTLKMGIERMLKEQIPEVKEVIAED